MFKAFDKWRIKRLDRKIDRFLLKSDDKIGKKYRHKDLKLSLLPPLLTALTILISIIGIIFAMLFIIAVFGLPFFAITFIVIVTAVLFSYAFSDDFEIISPCRDAWYDVITSHLDPIPEAMERWRYCKYYDVNSMISICYDYLFKENVDELLEDSESLTDAEYGRLVKPILAYIKLCLNIDDGNDAELRKEFIRKTDLERFLHEMMECKTAREMKLNELKNKRERAIKDNTLGKIDAITKTIGMDRSHKEASESSEMKRLNDVNVKLKKKINELETKVVRGQDAQGI